MTRNHNDNDDDSMETSVVSPAFLSQRVQTQVLQAQQQERSSFEGDSDVPTKSTKEQNPEQQQQQKHPLPYKPSLFWLDEYGSLQSLDYGAHGHGSNFLLSLLDQRYKKDLSRDEALALMNECFQELRHRYVINSPEAPCIKCVDAHGVKVI